MLLTNSTNNKTTTAILLTAPLSGSVKGLQAMSTFYHFAKISSRPFLPVQRVARGDPDRASHLEDLRQFRLHLLRARKTGFLYPENEGVDREVLRC